MEDVTLVGIDFSKHTFHVHGQDRHGKALLCKKFNREQLNHSSAERLGPPRKQMRQPLKTSLQASPVPDAAQRDPDCIHGFAARCECFRRRDGDALAVGCTRKL